MASVCFDGYLGHKKAYINLPKDARGITYLIETNSPINEMQFESAVRSSVTF